jgi:serine/threonine protein kinase
VNDHLRGNVSSHDETEAFDETDAFSLADGSDGECPRELANHLRYRIIKKLGAGGMGVVYQAEHRLMERPVALKVINRKLVSNNKAIERFRLEVKAAAKLSHRNIVTAHDAEQEGDLHFLVMEFVDGESLAETVKRRGLLPLIHVCNYIVQVAQGLQHAFEQGMVHRDIKPQNLMRTPKGTIKILDFGLARFASESDASESARLTKVGVTLGTTDYVAPEQVQDARNVDIRADIYSLGCTFYYLLAGRVPFPEGSPVDKLTAHLKQPPRSLVEIREDLPVEVVRIVERMMAKDPAKRFQTPAEVIDVLTPLARKSGSQPASSTSAERSGKPTQPAIEIEVTQEMQSPIVKSEGNRPATHKLAVESPRANSPVRQSRESVAPGKWLQRHGRQVAAAGGAALILLGLCAAYPLIRGSWPPSVAKEQQVPSHQVAETGRSPNGEAEDALDPPDRRTPPVSSPGRDPTVLYVLPQQNLWWPDFDPPRDALERANIRVVVASSTMDDIRAGQNVVQVDLLLSDADARDYDMVLFGGAPDPDRNMEFVYDDAHRQTATDFINNMLRGGKHVATVCNGTGVLAESGCLEGLRVASSSHLHRVQERHSEITWINEPLVSASEQILTAGSSDEARRLFNERIVSLLTDR